MVFGDYTVTMDPIRLEATMRAFARLLQEQDFSPKLIARRNRFERWLAEAAGP